MNELSKYLAEQILLTEEELKNFVVVYAGRFQPFHKGHFATYQGLVKKFGKDKVYIGTSNKTDNQKSPFNFKEKKTIMTKMFGIQSNKIVEVKNPYAPTEILKNFDDTTTGFITVVGEKDEQRLGGKYFEKYKGKIEFGYKDKGYVYASPAQPNAVSGTDVRNWLSNGTDDEKRKNFLKAYPKFDETVYKFITLKLGKLGEGLTESINEDVKWQDDTYKKCMLGKLPLSLNIVQKLVEPIRTTSLHATDIENLPKVAALQGSKKSISTFTQTTKWGKLVQGKGMHTKGGIIVALSGVVLAQSIMDLWTEPDKQGRRWVNPGTVIANLGREQDVVFNFAPELKKYKEDWKKHSFDGTITNKEKAEFIKKYYDAAEKYMLSKKKEFQDKYLNSNGLYYDSDWNEVVLSQIKIEGILVVPDLLKVKTQVGSWTFDREDKDETENIIKQLKQKYKNVVVANNESDIQNFIKKNGGTIKEGVNEDINLDVEIGDTILMGKFKNKKVVVKSIGKDEHGMPTINGKKATTFRVPKKENLFNETANISSAGEDAQPDGGYLPKGKIRKLGGEDGANNGDDWFARGGYIQTDFPKADAIYAKDDENQNTFKIKSKNNVRSLNLPTTYPLGFDDVDVTKPVEKIKVKKPKTKKINIVKELVDEYSHLLDLLEASNEDEKYTHLGYGRYKEKGKEKDQNSPTFTKDDNGKYIQSTDTTNTPKQSKPTGQAIQGADMFKHDKSVKQTQTPQKSNTDWTDDKDGFEIIDDERSQVKNIRKYTDEELQGETGEYFSNDVTKNTAPNAFKDESDMIQQMQNAEPTYLSSEQLQNMNNSDVGDILSASEDGGMDAMMKLGQELATDYGKDWNRLSKGIASGADVPPPIALRDKNGDLHLVAGNTRLMSFTASGKNLPVKVIDYDGEFKYDNTPTNPSTEKKRTISTNIKRKISGWAEKEKEFFTKGQDKPNSETRRTFGEALRDKAKGAGKAIAHGFKHEVHLFKEAAGAIKKFTSGEELSDSDKKAVKDVAIKVVTTAVTAAAMGGLAGGVIAFAKLVAIELVPHVVIETLAVGAGKAAVFADTNEDERMVTGFLEKITEGLETMEIPDEVMEKIVDSWNTKNNVSEMSKSQLSQIEKYAEKQLSPEDIEFTNHFFDRVNDTRNGKGISDAELTGFFKRLSRHKKEFKDFLDKYQQIVVKDKRNDINIPFVKQTNQIIAKTIMRKADFKTTNPTLSVEIAVQIDKIPGGLANGLSLSDIAKKHNISDTEITAEFKLGYKTEREHTTDSNFAKEIALDHLFEDPKYYTKLVSMEEARVPQSFNYGTGWDYHTAIGTNPNKYKGKTNFPTKYSGQPDLEDNSDDVNELTKGEIFGGTLKIGGQPVKVEVELMGSDNKKKVFITKVVHIDSKYRSKLPSNGVLEIPARIFKTPGGGWYKIKTPKAFENVNEVLLKEGGAYGHMNHPFDTEINLTFGQLKDIVNRALEGNLELAREKTDGQALAISWVNGRLVAARNKGHLANKGANALDISGIATKFAGRGELEKAYNFAMQDLTKAIKSLSDKQKEKIFKNGACFMNIEVIYPTSVNVIPYGQPLLVFHGTMEYDESGSAIGEDQQSGRILGGMIKQIEQNVQDNYTLQGPPVLKLPKTQNLSSKKPKYLAKISKLQKEFSLGDNAGVAEYHQAWWENFVDKKSPSILDNTIKVGLVKRWAFGERGFRIDKNTIKDEKTLAWATKTDKEDHKTITKDNLMKFEDIFLGVGAEVLSFTASVLTVNPDKAVRDMIKRLDQTIKDVEASGDPKKIEKLKLELKRLNAIGGPSKIVPIEGIVFIYNGKTFKLTGAFASLNQLLGIFY